MPSLAAIKPHRAVALALVLLLLAAFLLLLGGGWSAWGARRPANMWRTAVLERGALVASISAAGQIAPRMQVSVGTQVSGQIKDVLVDFNSPVKVGQLLARIDAESIEYRVRQARADLDAARAAVTTAVANVAAAQAAVARAQLDQAEAERNAERKRALVEQGFIAASESDSAAAAASSSRQARASAEAQLGVAKAQVASAEAGVAQRQAALAQAEIDLARTQIVSPVDGVVVKRSIERGQTVAASLQAPELFVIAQNLRDMQVEASIDEADIGRLREGQKASFTVDAYAGRQFEGVVTQVRKASQTVSNVVTYTAVIGFANTDERLLPGMTANVRILIDQRDSALKVPNAALRVRAQDVATHAGEQAAPARPADGAKPTAAAASVSQRGSRGRIYVLDDAGRPQAVDVRLGISDGATTELLPGDDATAMTPLREGATVITGRLAGKADGAGNGGARVPTAAGPRPPF